MSHLKFHTKLRLFNDAKREKNDKRMAESKYHTKVLPCYLIKCFLVPNYRCMRAWFTANCDKIRFKLFVLTGCHNIGSDINKVADKKR